MSTIWLLAAGTFGEAMRRKILLVFLFVALALIVMGFAFASFTPTRELVVIKSLGLGVIGLAGVFISVILGINLIPNEIERRTIYTILSKPVQRWQFVCGKFLGGLLTVLSNIALMGVAFIILMAIKERGFNHDVWNVAKGVLMIFFQLTLVGAVALFFSVFLSPFVNFFLTFAVYLLGSTDIFGSLADDPDHKKNPIADSLFNFLHYITPNFGNYNIQNPIINPHVIITNEGHYLLYLVGYAIVWTALLLTFSVLIFDRREV
jgi:ABC-type transport system involved in multi-copper enzyme maturation permease subunit